MTGDELLVELVRERIESCDDEQLSTIEDIIDDELRRRRQREVAS